MAINDDNMDFLKTALGKTGQFNDLYFEYLRGQGFTGSLQDMIAASGYTLNPSKGGGGIALLDDTFLGTAAPLAGRAPPVGPIWGVTGPDAVGVLAGGGEMYDSVSSGGVYYGTAALGEKPREIGCRFQISDPFVSMVLGGTISSGKLLAIQIVPSGVADASFTQVNYTTTGGDTTLAIAATNFAAAITANAAMASAGITAAAAGQAIQLRATKCPRIRTPYAEGPITARTDEAGLLTLASYVTGNDFLLGMVHFRSSMSGVPVWTIYNGGELALSSFTVAFSEGLKANTQYVYRCQIDGQNVAGGIWEFVSGTQITSVSGSDSRIATLAGSSAFWEGSGTLLRFNRAWATLGTAQIS